MKEFNQENYKQLGQWQFILEIPITFAKVGQIKSITFEIRTKENGHNEPHCHVKYQGQEISISLLEGHRILAGNLNRKQQAEAIKWVKENIIILRQYWNEYHSTEIKCL